MSSSEFVPGNAVREAVVPLTVVNVVVLGAIIHQATIRAPIGACPGTQKACSRVTTLATFSSRHVLHMQAWNFSVQSRSCSTWQNTHTHIGIRRRAIWKMQSFAYIATLNLTWATSPPLGNLPKWNAWGFSTFQKLTQLSLRVDALRLFTTLGFMPPEVQNSQNYNLVTEKIWGQTARIGNKCIFTL